MLSKIVTLCATKRAKSLFELLRSMLPDTGTVLDFGCGIGHFGYELEKQTNCQLTYLDVRSYPFMHPKIRLQCYDGITIPYGDLSHDYSMAVFTLHHTKDAYESLKELVRVTRKRIIISEDFIASPVHKYTEVVKDVVANCFFTTITMQYKQDKEWETLFSKLGLSVINKKHFSSFFFPFRFKHVAWVLEKESAQKKDNDDYTQTTGKSGRNGGFEI
jgi:ubiquinone/menaquinone biosynthesis C-methylase UbiE